MNRNAIYDAWRGLSGTSRAALGLLAAALVVVLWVAPAVFSSIFAGSLHDVAQPAPPDANGSLAFDEAVKANVDFIAKRSPFFAPVGPRPEVKPPVIAPRDPVTPPPRSYGGPKLVGLVGHEGAVFASNVYNESPFVRIGEKGGVVELVSIEQPWKAKVRWGGADFEINLFDRLEALPVINYGGTGARPTANVFGGGAASTAAGGLDFGGSATGDDSAVDNN